MDDLAARYESLPYPESVHAATHPQRVAAAGLLAGVNPPDPAAAAILEVGCGCGTNLISIARTLPGSRCLGIDFAASHIQRAQEAAADVENVRFLQGDLREFQPEEKFDYVIAHGVFSWVPDDARTALLRLCSEHLNPDGMAYIGFNCYPGWATHEPLRRLLFEVFGPSVADTRFAEARKLLELLAGTWGLDQKVRSWQVAALAELRQHPAVVAHDLLSAENRPLYFSEFTHSLVSHDLKFLTDATEPLGTTHVLPPEMKQFIATQKLSPIQSEQLADFARMRQHRSVLVVHSAAGVQPPGPAIMDRLSITTQLRPAPGKAAGDGEFVTPSGAVIRTRDQLVSEFLGRLIAAAEPRPFLHVASDASAHLRRGSATPQDLSALREVAHSMIGNHIVTAQLHSNHGKP